MARPAGIEPTTLCLEGRCSIQLSYGRGRRDISGRKKFAQVWLRSAFRGAEIDNAPPGSTGLILYFPNKCSCNSCLVGAYIISSGLCPRIGYFHLLPITLHGGNLSAMLVWFTHCKFESTREIHAPCVKFTYGITLQTDSPMILSLEFAGNIQWHRQCLNALIEMTVPAN